MVLPERPPYAEHFYELRRMNDIQLLTLLFEKNYQFGSIWSRFQEIYNNLKYRY